MTHKICKECGEINSGSARYCSNCNSSLLDVKKTEQSTEPINYSKVQSIAYSSDTVTIGQWVGIMIVLAIPFINIIALFVIAFGEFNESINNFGKASLILALVGIVIAILLRGCTGLL
ncbi:hypothetical protein SH1V18_44370 [Vallitalea longa]|uniref:Zinc-ribbon domain-containing protein n=1 Tax=Vallitalea longa TaxID=2936439 RepID=A0A9W5YDH7_9FIRM|nr:hypothetical protein [Vallitalea longa]GKX31957.1 hypothetical protein SH1V18_44370 [Vallitalea longa]